MATVRNPRVLRIIFLTLIVVFFCPIAYGKVIYVDDDAVGAKDGSSWADAFNYLQDALVDAKIADKPVEIHVAQGIYKPDQGSSIMPGDTNVTFRLFNDVIIKGGYAGLNEHDPNICDVVLYETVLSGDLVGNDLPFEKPYDIIIEPSIADNSYRIVTANAVDNNTILEGFIITGAIVSRYVVEVNEPEFKGAGLFISDNSNIIVRNCIFTKNSTSGIFCKNSSPTFINCTFKRNIKRGHGAGMCIRGSNIRIKSCIFNENHSFAGGGIESSESMLWLENCVFTQNVVHGCRCAIGGLGGALCCGDPLAGSKITQCSFSNNIAIGGAGIFIGTYDRISFGRGEEIQVTGCSFTHNRASFGAAIDNYTNSIMIENSSFIDNSSINSGGAVSNTFGTTSFSNCLFTGNSASQSASVISAHGSCWPDGTLDHFFAIEFKNCTLVENIAPLGRMVACRSEGSAELDSVQISNCIISNGGNEIYNPDGSRITINYTDLLGGISSIDDPCNTVFWDIGNIDENPLFVDPGYWDANGTPDDPNDDFWVEGDYHLKSQAGRWDPNSQRWVQDDVTSPCIDAGDPNTPVAFEPSPNGVFTNMGAYGGTAEASKSPSGLHDLYGGGTGEPNDPYQIYTAEQMCNIGNISHHWDKHFKLMADINLGEYGPKGCRTIGSYNEHSVSMPFTGVFDGNGKKIFNFIYSSRGLDDVGLFGYVYGSMGQVVIKDLGLVDPNIDARNGRYVGSLVGLLLDGTITDCYVQGGSISGGNFTGGLVGACAQVSMMTQREIINCYCTSTISGDRYVGGLVGSYSGTITNCYFAGNIAGYEYVGGLLGESFYSKISNCYSTGMVLGIHQVGGLIGSIWGHDAVFRSTSSSSVIGFDQVGGFVGLNMHGEIFNCYSTGSISGISNVAGLVGVNQGTVSNCYSAGSVEGTTDVGGLVGSLNAHSFYPDGNVSNSFWDIEVSRQNQSAGGIGKTTAQMQTASTFVGWSFDTVWTIDEGKDYPRLWWEAE